jgi:gamma-glutamylcyclotransferase (GGCT)/AIG2-like uncharacterized protein YtfP
MATTLYFAYGSNLDPQGMANRCPAAVVVGRARLVNWRLAFYGVASVDPAPGDSVHGLLWECTDACIARLDMYEGVAGGFYRKERLKVEARDGDVEALVYVMNVRPYDQACMPNGHYLDTIVRGYDTFHLPLESLRKALRRCQRRAERRAFAWDDDGRKRLRPVGLYSKPTKGRGTYTGAAR